MAWLNRLKEARTDLEAQHTDPWLKKLEGTVRGIDAMSTAALLDILRVPAGTGTARRLAKNMRELNFVAIKSRRLMPGGFRDTMTRGWARPVRVPKKLEAEKAARARLDTPVYRQVILSQKEATHDL